MLLSNWAWKMEPGSPDLLPFDSEEVWLFEDGTAEQAFKDEPPLFKDEPPSPSSRAQVATKLLQDLDDMIKKGLLLGSGEAVKQVLHHPHCMPIPSQPCFLYYLSPPTSSLHAHTIQPCFLYYLMYSCLDILTPNPVIPGDSTLPTWPPPSWCLTLYYSGVLLEFTNLLQSSQRGFHLADGVHCTNTYFVVLGLRSVARTPAFMGQTDTTYFQSTSI
uniref:Uncharacterized protein n=1 Tax=Timema tahoe TaxID=61484 RepID=A0A7R9IM10_9NEOP|nr:unnamed protein product [Timema tahoe]